MDPFLLICGTLLILWIIKTVQKKYSYFSYRNVLSPKATFPLGNFWKVGISVHFIEKINSIYREFKGRDILCGFYIFTKPVYMILDLDLLKHIMVKDFYSFHDRGLYHNEKTGEGSNLSVTNDEITRINHASFSFYTRLRIDPLSAHLFSVNLLLLH
jgi:hypothetical protein